MTTTAISISRDSGYADRFRAYSVVCDDAEIGRIRNGTSANFELAPGTHRLMLKVDWCSSNEVSFTIDAGQKVSFSCGSNLRGFRVLLAIYYIVFARTRYLWLRRGGV
jgi:hypothetical protein